MIGEWHSGGPGAAGDERRDLYTTNFGNWLRNCARLVSAVEAGYWADANAGRVVGALFIPRFARRIAASRSWRRSSFARSCRRTDPERLAADHGQGVRRDLPADHDAIAILTLVEPGIGEARAERRAGCFSGRIGGQAAHSFWALLMSWRV